jgi:hypothetical protein
MKEIMAKVVGIGIGLTVLFLLLNSVIMSNYSSAGGASLLANYTNSTGYVIETRTIAGGTSAYQGLLVLVFILAIIGIAMAFLKKK